MVTPNTLITPAAMEALCALANSKSWLAGTPYLVPTSSAFPQWVDPNSPGGEPYAAGDTVTFAGGLFASLVNDNTAPPTNPANWKGEGTPAAYSSSAAYQPLDVVQFGVMNYISTTGQTGNCPQNATGGTNAGWVQHYLTALNNLRGNLQTSASSNLTIWQQAVSGPWPCGPSTDYNDLLFIFPSTTGLATVTLGQSFPGTDSGTGYDAIGFPCAWSYTEVDGITTDSSDNSGVIPYPCQYVTNATFELIVGGDQDVQLSGTFMVAATLTQGTIVTGDGSPGNPWAAVSDGTDPAALASVDATDWIPGAGTWSQSTPFPTGSIDGNSTAGVTIFTCTIATPITVSPGKYHITLKGAAPGPAVLNQPSGLITTPSWATCLSDAVSDWPPTLNCAGVTVGLTNSSASLTDGVHNSESVYEIACPQFNHDTVTPFGLWSLPYAPLASWINGLGSQWVYSFSQGTVQSSDASNAGWSQPTGFAPVLPLSNYEGVTISATVPGVWSGVIQPVGGLGMALQGYMPWNLFSVNSGNATNPPWPTPPFTGGQYVTGSAAAVAYGGLVETQTIPNQWNALTHYPPGYVIADSNGNWQQCAAPGRSFTQAPAQTAAEALAIAGALGLSSFPVWSQTLGGVTQEPAYTFLATGRADPDGPAKWVMIPQPAPAAYNSASPPVNTAFASMKPRLYSSPPYPVMKSTDTWQANTWVKIGQKILDTNGDLRVVTAFATGTTGKTGATQPTWSLGSIAAVTDGQVTWDLYLQNIGPNGSADGTGNLGFNGDYTATGQCGWIISVSINAVTAGTATTCQIGCIRNGAFVPFTAPDGGTSFATGTTVRVLWPIFTNSPLVYVCPARLDIQAAFLSGTPTPWGGIGWPLLADFYNDMEALLMGGVSA